MATTLRKIERRDAELIASWKNDAYVREMALDPGFSTTGEEQAADIGRALSDGGQRYEMILLDGEPIGYVRIDWMDDRQEKAWLRFALGRERGRGFAELALRPFIAGLIEGGCLRIEAETYEANAASRRILEKLGFKKEGVKRKAHFDGKGHADVYAYGLLADEFVA